MLLPMMPKRLPMDRDRTTAGAARPPAGAWALAVGLQVAAWWLLRWRRRSPLTGALVAGLCAVCLAFLAGPAAVALLGVAGAAWLGPFDPDAATGTP